MEEIEVRLNHVSCRFRSLKVHMSDHFSFTIFFCRHHSSQAIKTRIISCEEECEATKGRLEADIHGKQHQLELLNNRISSLMDLKGVESTIKKLDAEYEQLQAQQQKEEKENIAKIKAVTDELANEKRRMAVVKDLIKAIEISKDKLVEDIEVSLTHISCGSRSQCQLV